MYHTAKDKAIANCTKSQHSYHKGPRNKLPSCVSKNTTQDTVTSNKGHAKIYKTPEDQIMANRAKSKCSYNKHKAAISAHKAVRYHVETAPCYILIRNAQKGLLPKLPPDPDVSSNDPVTVSGWLAWTTKLCSKFVALTKGNTTTFMEGLYQGYVVSCWKDKICDAIIKLEGLWKATTHCLNGILQLAGVEKDLDKVQHLDRLIREALSWLEDIMCYVVGRYSEVMKVYMKQRLLYQAFM
ncbi:hypothetical protein BDN71DRAFT_1433998 [Pleurotus eryngii]|uniref:Uncharacterized protein n=1 Tax=Pleurotus eryngii TaxID=5323 RepID=A0A9P6D3Q6_PLEER|nr:hypothetical protein BDN71DRAFT_1433998 [Pleurotus eryngii]